MSTPIAEGGIHRDFEQDVLERLQKHGAKMYGCPIIKIESRADGSIAARFKGLRDGLMWEGGFGMNLPLISQKKAFADAEAVTQTALQLLEQIGKQTSQPLIQRAS